MGTILAFFHHWAIENDCPVWEGDWNALSRVDMGIDGKERAQIHYLLSSKSKHSEVSYEKWYKLPHRDSVVCLYSKGDHRKK